MNQVIVIGGGAAGYFAAIACARNLDSNLASNLAKGQPEPKVILIEAGRQPLAKVKISGGGRCNVTHSCFDPAVLVRHYPRGGKALRGAFSRFQPRDTIAWFAAEGVQLKTEADGRLFPISDDSATIVDCLTEAARKAGVTIVTGVQAIAVSKSADKFQVTLKSGVELWGDRLLLATGSSPQGHQIARSLGHEIITPVPSLFTFNINDPDLRELAGVSVGAGKVKLLDRQLISNKKAAKDLEQTGAILIAHWGLTGPAVLKLSAWAARILAESDYQATLQVNWLPQYSLETCRQQIIATKAEVPRRAIANFRPFPEISQRLWQYLVARAEIPSQLNWADLSQKAIQALSNQLLQSEYAIAGKGIFKEEFVTCGGVNLDQVDFKTMESRLCPGLYFAGEILDIDGVTGGFNFQSAWTTAYLAGMAITS